MEMLMCRTKVYLSFIFFCTEKTPYVCFSPRKIHRLSKFIFSELRFSLRLLLFHLLLLDFRVYLEHIRLLVYSSLVTECCSLYSILSSFVSFLFLPIAKRCSINSSPLILSSLFCSLSSNSILDKTSALLFNMPFL